MEINKRQLILDLYGVPKSPNQLTARHWAVKEKEIKRWNMEIWVALQKLGYRGRNPQYPKFINPKIVITQYRYGKLDNIDNLKASVKFIIDQLTPPLGRKKYGLGIIAFDDRELIDDDVKVKQERIKRSESQHTTIIIEEEERCRNLI